MDKHDCWNSTVVDFFEKECHGVSKNSVKISTTTAHREIHHSKPNSIQHPLLWPRPTTLTLTWSPTHFLIYHSPTQLKSSWWNYSISYQISYQYLIEYFICWVHKDLTVTTKQIQDLLTAARASGGEDECQVRLTGIERKYWMGTEVGRLGGYVFRGTVTAGDGSNQKGGKMGAECVNLRKQRKRQQRKDPSRTVGFRK